MIYNHVLVDGDDNDDDYDVLHNDFVHNNGRSNQQIKYNNKKQ